MLFFLCHILERKIKLLPADDSWTQTHMSFLDRSGERKAWNNGATGEVNLDFGVAEV